ncbi:MAG: translation initiation factor IF-2 [Acidobacteriota bacterium]
MDKLTVAQLATECAVPSRDILAELKRLGLYVFSPTATIDASFAETIRKKIQAQQDAEAAKAADEEKKEAEAAKKTEKKAAAEPAKKPKAASKKKAPAKAASAGKKVSARTAPTPAPEAEVMPKASLAPRKGRRHYHAEPVEAPEAPEVAAAAIVEAPPPEELLPEAAAEAALPAVAAPEAGEVEMVAAPPEAVAPVQVPPAAHPVAEAVGRPAAKPAELAPAPGVPSKKIVVRKPKSQVLMRTTAQRVVTPVAPERILRELREEKAGRRGAPPARQVRRKRPDRVAGERAARVLEMPRPAIVPAELKPLKVTEGVTIKELAEKTEIKSKFIMQKLINRGILASINQSLDIEIAREICAEFGFRAEVVSFEEEVEARQAAADAPEDYVARAPVVTIMGHVDHGKTSLLDAIRETNVTATEAGGITQHIGAYMVEVSGRKITFLDTPGHEAFTLMRARGAQATDIVVLVVAADDGVMPQTTEAIHHARAANVPILVAINKIDRPGAQLDRVKQQLADQNLLAEDFGGDVVMVPVSAKQKTNLNLMLEMILLVADMRDMRANPKRHASGVVLEAKVDRGRGCVATVLVQNGILRVGDPFVAGAVHGRVRALMNDRGSHLQEAEPSVPVEIQGLQDLPQAGDTFQVFEDASKARSVAEHRQNKIRESALQTSARLSLQALYEQLKEGRVKELSLILKADVQGSAEALVDVLNRLSSEKVKLKILHSGAGAVTETDVLLASASNAIIIAFNVRPERKAEELADSEGVEIRNYTVIYDVANDIKNAMIGMLDHTLKEKYIGRAEVRDTFRVPKFGFVAGSYIVDGIIRRNSEIRLLRDNVVIHEGKIGSLRRFKDDVSEVKSGYECGIGLESFSDVKIGDIIEAYVIEKIQPTTL